MIVDTNPAVYLDVPLATERVRQLGRLRAIAEALAGPTYGAGTGDLEALVETWASGTAKSDFQTRLATDRAARRTLQAAVTSAMAGAESALVEMPKR